MIPILCIQLVGSILILAGFSSPMLVLNSSLLVFFFRASSGIPNTVETSLISWLQKAAVLMVL